jgi:hypothetical protein
MKIKLQYVQQKQQETKETKERKLYYWINPSAISQQQPKLSSPYQRGAIQQVLISILRTVEISWVLITCMKPSCPPVSNLKKKSSETLDLIP